MNELWSSIRNPSTDPELSQTLLESLKITPPHFHGLNGDAILKALEERNWNLNALGPTLKRARKHIAESRGWERKKLITLLVKVDTFFAEENRRLLLEIESLKVEERGPTYRQLIQLLYSYSNILPGPRVTQQFYRKEALAYNHLMETEGHWTKEDLMVRWEILISLGMPHQSIALLDNPAYRKLLSETEVIYLEAKGQYILGNYLDIPGIFESYPLNTELDNRQRLRQYWAPRKEEHDSF